MVEIAPRVVVDPTIRFGKPVIKGTRVPVDVVIAKLAGGMTAEEVIAEYGISTDDLCAALSYAASILSEENVRVPAQRGEISRRRRSTPLDCRRAQKSRLFGR